MKRLNKIINHYLQRKVDEKPAPEEWTEELIRENLGKIIPDYDFNKLDKKNGQTALIKILKADYYEIQKIKPLKPKVPDNNYNEILGFKFKLASELLSQFELDINAQDNDGRTALMWACQNEPELISILSEYDNNQFYQIDPNIQDNFGDTALTLACNNSVDSFSELLRINKNQNVVNIDYNQKNSFNQNILMIVCQYENKNKYWKTIIHLLEHLSKTDSFNINEQDDFGKTALMYACLHDPNPFNSKSIVGFFLEKLNKLGINQKLNLNIQDENGETGLMMACRDNPELISKLLEQSEIKVNLKNNKGETAFDIFRKNFEEYNKQSNDYKNILNGIYREKCYRRDHINIEQISRQFQNKQMKEKFSNESTYNKNKKLPKHLL